MPTRHDQVAVQSAILAVFCLSAGIGATPACAQVLEIGEHGEVVVHDRPEVTLTGGATAIRPSISAPRTRTLRHCATDGRQVAVPIEAVAQAASLTGLSSAIIEAVAWQESRHHAEAISRKGAIGEMQLMPETARRLGVDPRVSAQNYLGGAAYLSGLLRRYAGDLPVALAAYNAGPAAVDHYHGLPPFKETRAYVASILDRLSRATDVAETATR